MEHDRSVYLDFERQLDRMEARLGSDERRDAHRAVGGRFRICSFAGTKPTSDKITMPPAAVYSYF